MNFMGCLSAFWLPPSTALSTAERKLYAVHTMSPETQPVRIETGEEVALELMKFIAEKEAKNLQPSEVRDYYLDLFIECAHAVYEGERLPSEEDPS